MFLIVMLCRGCCVILFSAIANYLEGEPIVFFQYWFDKCGTYQIYNLIPKVMVELHVFILDAA